jgi:hypothetical protein
MKAKEGLFQDVVKKQILTNSIVIANDPFILCSSRAGSGARYLKGLSHEMDLAFDDMHGQSVLGLNF